MGERATTISDAGGHAARDRQRRARQIAEVLARHGLGYLVGVFGLERLVPFHRGLLGHARRPEPYARPEHVRMALEELGATFIKLGQILSTRSDLVPPEYQAELAKLQDQVPPAAPEALRETLAADLGRPIEELFASFDGAPLAAASIGQAHAATLPSGAEVVVKIRRPGVVEQIEQDLEILSNLAAAAARRWDVAQAYDVVGLAQEFATTLRAEVDYLREARSAERIAASFAGDPAVHIPRVFWDTTTTRVLTLERIRGIKVSDVAALDAAGIDRKALAERAARVTLKMVFEDGFFHADPHPGNFFVEPGGRLGLVDFGMVGVVDEETQDQLVSIVLALTAQDSRRLAEALMEVGVARGRVDREHLRRDLEGLMARYYGRALGEIAIGPLLEEAFGIVRRHRLQLPPRLALLLKMAVMSEGLGARLDPDFHLTAVLEPYAERLLLRRYSPARVARRLGEGGAQAAQLGMDLPAHLRRIVADLEHGAIEVGVRPERFEPLLLRLERLTHRLVLGMLAAAFIVALGVVMAAYHPPGWEAWLSPMLAFGVLMAAGLATLLAWTILRSGRW